MINTYYTPQVSHMITVEKEMGRERKKKEKKRKLVKKYLKGMFGIRIGGR